MRISNVAVVASNFSGPIASQRDHASARANDLATNAQAAPIDWEGLTTDTKTFPVNGQSLSNASENIPGLATDTKTFPVGDTGRSSGGKRYTSRDGDVLELSSSTKYHRS